MLEAPAWRIAANAGVDGDIVVEKIKENEGGFGFNGATGEYCDLVAAGIIDPALRDAALRNEPRIAHDPPASSGSSFVERKAANAIRTRLLSLLGLSSLYTLDRLDLTVETTFDAPSQERVTTIDRKSTRLNSSH